jgi:hypothetical protein
MRDLSLIIPRPDGEVRISLHPISLALVLAELVEDAANEWCRRRGHSTELDGHCERCGRSLPDNGSPYGAWFPPNYRSWGERPTKEAQP